jgi:hypothetical protein
MKATVNTLAVINIINIYIFQSMMGQEMTHHLGSGG